MGADYFESMQERLVLRERGGIPIGIGRGTTVRRAILDKNVRIGNNVTITNANHIEEADRPELNFYIRNGIVVIVKNGSIPDGTVI
jgi:glucose-1-phosphate adenylyltransferase